LLIIDQAPIRNAPRPTAQPPKSILKKSPTVSISESASPFPSTKKDKRRIKHAQLINRVTKSASKPARRRRPNKKIVTTLDALADALPDDDKAEDGTAVGERLQDQVNIIRRKSLKSKPGAMKRREKVDQGERERFKKNMAQLAAPKAGENLSMSNGASIGSISTKTRAVTSTSERWAALRGFISQTLETRPDVKV
jgi:hypothetical protein